MWLPRQHRFMQPLTQGKGQATHMLFSTRGRKACSFLPLFAAGQM